MGTDSKEWQAIAIALGTRVTDERERAGLSKEALAERSGLASRYLWRVEAGLQNVQLHTVERLAKGLGLTVAALMEGVEELVENPRPRPAPRPRGPSARRKGTES